MLRKMLAGAVVAMTALTAGAQAAEMKELNFGIISTESSQNLKTVWQPFLSDMEKKLGMKVNAYFAPDYAGIIEGMRFKKVDVAWYGNKSAMEAVDRANGEIFVQTVAADGSAGYYSLLIAHKDVPVNDLKAVVENGKDYTFGNGDPNSTSGFLVPSYYVFALNGIDAKQHFKRMVTANHETNALAVANRQVDIATNNTESMDRIKQNFPEKYAQIKEIWRSPLIPSDPIVWRADLPAEAKSKIKAFFMDYGVKGPNVEAEKKVLAGLSWAPFRESSNDQLIPIRQLELFRSKTRIENDDKMAAAEKQQKLGEINAQLDALNKKMKTN
ncbi:MULTISPECIES: phosphonate ABC transporter substrate-binding protein [Oceanibaculum]|uniref:Phosphonate ABC transporter substrate-binding protein n=2 Tax=Oceanibaculum indicum TaxID=526216 RepID=K2J0G4_9PROT|nr:MULTISPECIES: phosphonate ABC transporter substrate-binding protein [Oceanibaculum]EKE76401.1 phosphonate ABC transporter substrate-binding protein [Oceanibaculum indicum P24]MCH2395770.1 phosphonate ABC transporter substrate-binding protein [Oceanibaculum sp.]RKQ73426.1 phosphonate transport system substrate-binding protein [Oceanibaculum indicum]